MDGDRGQRGGRRDEEEEDKDKHAPGGVCEGKGKKSEIGASGGRGTGTRLRETVAKSLRQYCEEREEREERKKIEDKAAMPK